MKPLYNSTKGRTARPRKPIREIGIMPSHLKNELSRMEKFECIAFQIGASMAVLNLGVDVLNIHR